MQKSGLLKALSELYPNPGSELHFKNQYQLIVAVILSAQCTDKKVNEVTPALFAKYPDFAALAGATTAAVEKIIRPVNYYRTKSKNIISMSRIIQADYRGKLPKTMAELIELPGVGRKTASVVLNETGAEHTLPVDTHVFRVSRRLGLAEGKNVREVEEDLRRAFPSHLWRNLHHWLILHGRRVCKAQRPLCSVCEIAKFCPAVKAGNTP